MKSTNRNSQSIEQKLSEQFVDFIDLTDENLEEISVQGGADRGFRSCGSCWSCGFISVSSTSFAGSCSCGSCSCGSCDFGSCSCGSCGSCFSCGSCGDFWGWGWGW